MQQCCIGSSPLAPARMPSFSQQDANRCVSWDLRLHTFGDIAGAGRKFSYFT